MAYPNWTMSGCANGGTSGSANVGTPRPVSESSPTNTKKPIPEASSPGSSTIPRVAPPSPADSINKKAPRMGEPNRALIAAKLPLAATIA